MAAMPGETYGCLSTIDFSVSPGSAPLLDLLSIQTPWWAGLGLGWC